MSTYDRSAKRFFGLWDPDTPDDWSTPGLEGVRRDFRPEPTDIFPTEDEVLVASYGTYSYEGFAFVLFEKGGTLYEVNGGHCSCYGLEGQWDPEETTWAALARGERLSSDYEEHDPEAVALLDRLIAENTQTEEETR